MLSSFKKNELFRVKQYGLSSVKKNELFRVNQNGYALRIPITLFSSEKHNYLSTMVWTVYKLEIRLPISQKKYFLVPTRHKSWGILMLVSK